MSLLDADCPVISEGFELRHHDLAAVPSFGASPETQEGSDVVIKAASRDTAGKLLTGGRV